MTQNHNEGGLNRRGCRVLSWLTLTITLSLFPAAAQAAPEGRPCSPEPTDMMIGYGDLIICQIDVVGDTDVFRFPGSTGEVVAIVASRQAGGGDPCVEVLDPQGANVGILPCSSRGAEIRIALAKSGTYTVRVSEAYNDQTISYALSLERISPPSPTATPLRFAQNLSDEISPVGDIDLFFFQGISGDAVVVSTGRVSGGGDACVEVFDPQGANVGVARCGYGGGEVRVTLATTGTYTVRVSEAYADQAVAYSVDLQCVGQCPSIPLPAMSVTLTGCTTCKAGDIFAARVVINNSSTPPRAAELKLGFYQPDDTPMNLGDPHLELPPSFTFDGEVVRGPLPSGLPKGTWRFCGRLLELQLGEIRSAACQTFTVGP